VLKGVASSTPFAASAKSLSDCSTRFVTSSRNRGAVVAVVTVSEAFGTEPVVLDVSQRRVEASAAAVVSSVLAATS
jgi:dienelactone hydrolase